MSIFCEIPSDREVRWSSLQTFLGRWYGGKLHAGPSGPPPQARAAEQRLGLQLPDALQEWLGRYDHTDPIWSCQDQLLGFGDLYVERDAVIFGTENQHVVHWGVRIRDLGQPDPPVFVSYPLDATGWMSESHRSRPSRSSGR